MYAKPARSTKLYRCPASLRRILLKWRFTRLRIPRMIEKIPMMMSQSRTSVELHRLRVRDED
jgi:hypothetical protein